MSYNLSEQQSKTYTHIVQLSLTRCYTGS